METSPMKDSKTENPEAKPNTQKLTAMAADAKANEAGSTGFMDPGSKVKNKGGRPKLPRDEHGNTIKNPKSPGGAPASNASASTTGSVPPTQPMIPTSKIVRPVVNLISKTGARLIEEPKAEMSPQEFDDIAEAAGLVMEKWMPLLAVQYGAEIYLGMALASWGSRLMAIRAVKEQERKEREKQEQTMRRPPPEPRNEMRQPPGESPYFSEAAPEPHALSVVKPIPPEVPPGGFN